MAKLVRVMWLPVLVAALYAGRMFWPREGILARPPKPATIDPLAKYGSDVKILQFYTRLATITQGSKALICYNVVNATAVRLDPAVESVWPSASRCFEVAPARNTRYTLTAEGAGHKTATETLDITIGQASGLPK